ncbi:diheme cytochrome c-553 [Pontibacter sp. JH31]|uniref:Diheme cytochrome c-553 n=1 Tax=Pontibacter aquaedesilientis TaxID=2766980 RepID=A0ABR7XBS2_9BACT|nr:diheme cytochrome c-553 [Pontibacter aquaedesilientis]MBD1395754.1 diheme cytochrome c-553 [Pontibacter aquaedesilientis]
MKRIHSFIGCLAIACIALFAQCSEARTEQNNDDIKVTQTSGQNDQLLKQGEHLVLIAGCHDCHTPKKMTDKGPVDDMSRALSGHPANMPPPDVDRAEMEKKGLAVTQTLTAWVGPWGISYASNLTSDKTGIGNWTEKNFFTAIRQGKHKGMENGRMLLPPMPWEMIAHMTDEELRAVFTYLKSTKPISNVVPAPQPPVSAAPGK